MKIQTKLLLLVMLVSVLCAAPAAVLYYRFLAFDKTFVQIPQSIKNVSDAAELNSVSQFIRYYDEVLTQSARNYAFTGNVFWRNRYNDAIPKLDEKIKEAIAKGTPEDKKIFISIDATNQELIVMEVKSMSLVDQNRKLEAQAILDSSNYSQQKTIYQAGLENYDVIRGRGYNDTLTVSGQITNKLVGTFGENLKFSGWIALLIFFFCIAAGFTVYFFIKLFIFKPLENMTRATAEIAKGNFGYRIGSNKKDEIGQLATVFDTMACYLEKNQSELQQSSKELEARVMEKTQELTGKVASLEEARTTINLEKIKYEALLSCIGDGVTATDNQAKIIVINNAAEEILGIKQEECYGKKLTDTLVLVDAKGTPVPENEKPINKAILTMKTFSTSLDSDYYYIRVDGTKIPVALVASPVIADGQLIGAIEVFRDVSREKNIDRMKTEFISLSSHQLRTPLSAIRWYGEMLLAGDAGLLSVEQKDYVNNIYELTEEMIVLVNSLLNVSRIESGRIVIDPEPTHLSDLINDVVREVKHTVDEKKQMLIISVHPDIPLVNIDPKLIREVYKNLITNSVKYTPAGGEISIFISKTDKEIISQVSDNGYGIPEKVQGKVFTKLFRADNVAKLETEGTGLGLYLAKAIVESSGGRIWFESIEGKGSSFWFALPFTGSSAKTGEVTINS